MNTMSQSTVSGRRSSRRLVLAGVTVIALLVMSVVLIGGRRKPVPPPAPAWQVGNGYLQRISRRDWAGAAGFCSSAETAHASEGLVGSLIARYGPLRGYGSIGSTHDLPQTVRQTSQLYQLQFERRPCAVVLDFVRDGSAGWIVSQVRLAQR